MSLQSLRFFKPFCILPGRKAARSRLPWGWKPPLAIEVRLRGLRNLSVRVGGLRTNSHDFQSLAFYQLGSI
ncbi:hypothetical protein [Chamaesiphon minutus]|uniref:hypothetical protein n=1 Tax=Chamaesiphon minutus TaxID=1173032 RepID=UPI0012FC89D7|nr:hypothetical protein [Chamaesiphon minutus]